MRLLGKLQLTIPCISTAGGREAENLPKVCWRFNAEDKSSFSFDASGTEPPTTKHMNK